MQAVIAETFGISLEQSRKASGVQAERCSGVNVSALPALTEPSSDAVTAKTKAAERGVPVKSVVMAVLLVDRPSF
jgi:hypothetical protein